MRNKINIKHQLKSKLTNLFLIVLVGLVLDYIYYGSLSLKYLFVGGVIDLFKIFEITINAGRFQAYNIFYLLINGLFYFYLYKEIISILMYLWRLITK